MKAAVGDRIVVKGHRSGEPDRDAEVLEVRGDLGEPPYVVRWSDNGIEGLYFPGPDARLQHFGEPLPAPRPNVGMLMARDVITVQPDDPFQHVLTTLLERDVSAVPVVDDDKHLVGIVSESDVVTWQAYGNRRRPLQLLAHYAAGTEPRWLRKAAGGTAADWMTKTVMTASVNDAPRTAARRMLEGRVKRLVVVDDGRVVGIVTRHDLLHALADEIDLQGSE